MDQIPPPGTVELGQDGLPLSSHPVINNSEKVNKIEDRGESKRPPTDHAHIAAGPVVSTYTEVVKSVVAGMVNASEPFAPDSEHNTTFVPHAEFEKIMSPNVVRQIVGGLKCYETLSEEQQLSVAKGITYGIPGGKPSRKLLAALITTGDKSEPEHSFETLIQDGMSDECLPLSLRPGVAGDLYCEAHRCVHGSINGLASMAWETFRETFLRWTRVLMPPFIMWEDGGKHCHYVMRGGGPLPTRPVSPPVVCANGGFGEVHKVRIDPGDRNFSLHNNEEETYFALKKLHRRDDPQIRSREFDFEVRTLIFAESRVNRISGPDKKTRNHLIQLLATFEIYNSTSDSPTYYLLFPWADGTLEELWKREDGHRNPRDKQQLGFMIHQFFYMAKTLHCVHNDRLRVAPDTGSDGHRFGRHGDIKPTNFLYFRNAQDESQWRGLRIVLADFGLGSLHSRETRSQLNAANVGHTITYAAPECDDLNSELLSQKSDIFSLGCVFLLYIVWFLEGVGLGSDEPDDEKQVLYGFLNARKHEKDLHPENKNFKMDNFWKYTEDGNPVIKDSVKQKFEELRNRDDCVEVVGEILAIIEDNMLQVSKTSRFNAEQLMYKLGGICQKWERADSLYGSRAWSESKKLSCISPFTTFITPLHFTPFTACPSDRFPDSADY